MGTKDVTFRQDCIKKSTNLLENLGNGVYAMDFNDCYYLTDHRVQGVSLMPGSQFISMACDILKQEGIPATNATIRNVEFHQMLSLDESPTLLGVVKEHEDTVRTIIIKDESGEKTYASMTVSVESTGNDRDKTPPINLNDIIDRAAEIIPGSIFYERLGKNGNEYGLAFQGVEKCWAAGHELLAVLKVPKKNMGYEKSFINPRLLDAAFHPLIFSQADQNKTAILTGCRKLQFIQSDCTPFWSYIRNVHVNQSEELSADIIILDDERNTCAVLHQVTFRLSDNTPKIEKPVKDIAVSATFTCDLVENAIQFWGQTTGFQPEIEFAPYNQVFQQLLNPAGLFSKPGRDLNVLLLNIEDWIVIHDSENVPSVTKNRMDSGFRLPNNMEIAHINKYETSYLYDEIFIQQCYLKHGITLHDGDTILDIGANIGMFSLFVNQQVEDATIYAFEPAPHAFKALEQNAQQYANKANTIHAENVGISDRTKMAEFTYYEKSSVFSSFNADEEDDSKAVRAIVTNMLKESGGIGDEELDRFADELMEDRMKSKAFQCPLKSISDIISDNGIQRIDLLKIDAEKSEQQILAGIEDEDWPKIKQMVIEVHDRQGDVIAEIKELLKNKGFEVESEEENLLQNSGLYNLFAIRGERASDLKETRATAIGRKSAIGMSIREDVESFIDIVNLKAVTSDSPYLIILCPPKPNPALPPEFLADMVDYINRRLSETANAYVVTPAEIFDTYPVPDYYDADSDQLGHIPYTRDFYHALGTIIVRKLDAIQRQPHKVVVLDCDNTLWKGVCGEVGPNGVVISDERKQLHKKLIDLKNSGFLLCLCSKNVEEDVLRVFEENEDMILKMDDVTAYKINWEPKSKNIRELADELDLGLDSFIFIDDNPIECAEVQAHCPEVLTLQLPENEDTIAGFMKHTWAFDKMNVTEEDRKRTTMYRQNMERKIFRNQTTTLESFLDGLELDITIRRPEKEDLSRASQLTMRTNQFNFTTIRRSQREIEQHLENGEMDALICEVSDRFGEYGQVGLILYKTYKNLLVADTFLLSCRVLGRGVEHKMLAELGILAREKNLDTVKIEFRESPKNKPALDFLDDVAEPYKRGTAGEYYYLIPVEVAENISYKPGESRAADKLSPKERSQPKPTQTQDVQYLKSIAEEFSSATAIFKAIDRAHKKSNRKVQSEYTAPETELQKTITEIWQEVLEMEKVGLHDNFSDLGGTSIKGIQLISKMRKTFNRDLSAVALYEYPTVNEMAQMLNISDKKKEEVDKFSEVKGRVSNKRKILRRRRH